MSLFAYTSTDKNNIIFKAYLTFYCSNKLFLNLYNNLLLEHYCSFLVLFKLSWLYIIYFLEVFLTNFVHH